jgi:hypothetical protein
MTMHETREAAAAEAEGAERMPSAGIAPPAVRGRPKGEWRDYYVEDPRRKSPILAVVMSLMPGLGQVYVGYYVLGFVNILIVGSLIALLNLNIAAPLQALAGLFLAFFWLYNLVDAGRRASLYNQALAGLGPTELPEVVTLPRAGAALPGGIVLIVLGLTVWVHTYFGLSFQWLERWWPLALVLVGAYLIWNALEDRRRIADAAPKNDSA